MLGFVYLEKEIRDRYWITNSSRPNELIYFMNNQQMNTEYSLLMLKADKANGRKEVVSLLHKADRIRTAISNDMKNPSHT